MKSKAFLLLFASLICIISISCSWFSSRDSVDQAEFNFSDTVRIGIDKSANSLNDKAIRIAVAAITSPKETFSYYREMLEYIEEQTGRKVLMVQRKTYEEINNLMELNEVDLAFVCSGGYVFGKDDSAFSLFVVPIREGKRVYQAYIIVHKNSGINGFEDLEGRKFAFTDPLSTSGNIYPQKRIKELGSNLNDFFYSHVFTYAHDNSIQLVSKQMVDGAAVNSLVYDYIASTSPGRVENIRIIEKSDWYGMPPVVVANTLAPEIRSELEKVFLNMHNDPKSLKVLEKLKYDRFVKENDTLFNSVRVLVGLTL